MKTQILFPENKSMSLIVEICQVFIILKVTFAVQTKSHKGNEFMFMKNNQTFNIECWFYSIDSCCKKRIYSLLLIMQNDY